MAAPLPLAAGLDWLEALLPILFVLFWIVSQVVNLFRGLGGGKREGPVVVRPAPRPAADDEAHRELARQIEEFVRRSQGERIRGPADARRARPAQPPLAGPQKSARPGRGPAPRRPAAPAVERAPGPLGSLGGHSRDVARHVEGAFGHELEHLPAGLAQPAVTASAAAAAPAVDIASLLRNPATLRQLVIVREVLERPVDRW